ncbi:MAG: MMPL family transporter, partial [Ruminococcus sp.]|nr:MMPL family transporter [Ruminococcus sp.]
VQNDERYQKDGHSKYLINISADTYSDESRQVLKDIREKYGDDVYLSGAVVDNDKMIMTLLKELPVIIAIVGIVIFVILLILCSSWIEPIVYLVCIGAAIALNMGSNAMLSSVSFMTFAVGALLQLGLSMDYSIMLMNRYAQEKQRCATAEDAMTKALTYSFAPISGSSVTTIVGLLALLFMSFKIGQDMGIVLAKGVFMSLVSIFTLLPGIVVSCDKLLEKTKKRSLNLRMGKAMKLITKAGFVIVPAVIVLVCFSFARKDDVKVNFLKSFDNEEQTYTEECFGYDSQAVLIYSNTEADKKVSEYIQWLEDRQDVAAVEDYSNTIGKQMTPKEAAAQLGFDEQQAAMMFSMLGKETMDLEELLDAAEKMMENMPDDGTLSQIRSAKELIQANKGQMLGKKYNRMVVNIKYAAEGEDTFKAIGELTDKAKEILSGEHYFVGDCIMGKEMNDGFKKELNFITLITAAAILVIVLITFRAPFGAALLVVVIQSAVYITTLIIVEADFTVNYITQILVQCILMGATIDYGILFICNYIEKRQAFDKDEALGIAMNNSIKTILTSSLILIGCCLTTGIMMSQKAISQACTMIACGTAIAAFMVVFVLPVLIRFTDKLAIKQFGRKNR